ncbi:hypothetical protein Clacol_006998 [Clathrus columnatus]|uniref:Peptidase A1 domain-containing protein n=1 Tax=Clathrus columnatus TaxID=1419009 RepID=A0AAV5AGY9_9AGAM|nr:hypothetical protein Clacol_006998 [Clathrus columnatus]
MAVPRLIFQTPSKHRCFTQASYLAALQRYSESVQQQTELNIGTIEKGFCGIPAFIIPQRPFTSNIMALFRNEPWTLLKLLLGIILFMNLEAQCSNDLTRTIKLSSQKASTPRTRSHSRRSASVLPGSKKSEPLSDFFNGTDLQKYLDFENFTVLEALETMTILDMSAPDVSLLLITNETAGLGLGFSPNRTIFFLFLTPKSVGNAELTLGGIDESRVNGTLIFLPIVLPEPNSTVSNWVLNSTNITVNGQTAPILSETLSMLIDSGTSNLVLSPNITEAIYNLISPNIKPHGNSGAFGLPCSEIDSVKADIFFTFTSTTGQPFTLMVPSEELSVGPFEDDPKICQTLINALDGINVLGGSLLKHYYSVWDVDHTQMGFVIPPGQLSPK